MPMQLFDQRHDDLHAKAVRRYGINGRIQADSVIRDTKQGFVLRNRQQVNADTTPFPAGKGVL